MATSRSGLYDDPVIYDVLHAPGTGEEVDGLEAIEKRFIRVGDVESPRLWLEPACGSGRYLREAARRGIDSVGFDCSDGMVGYARDHSPPTGAGVGASTYFVGEMTAFAERVGRARVTFAFNLINTVRHLPSDAAMLAHLDQVARVLDPGGVYVVGLSLTAYGCEAPSEDVWTGARGPLRVTQMVRFMPPRSEGNPKTRAEQVVSRLTIERPGGTEHRDSAYTLRTLSLKEWLGVLDKSRLRVIDAVDEVGESYPAADGGYHLFVLGRRSRR